LRESGPPPFVRGHDEVGGAGMARDDDAFNRTIVHGESALQRIRQHRVAAHPRNYEFWYTYASGFHLRLNRTVDATIAENGRVTEGDIAELYDRYLASPDLGEQVDELGVLALGELDQVMATIDSANGSASAYGTKLHTLHSSLTGNSGRDALRFVIEQLMTETREMEETNHSLRERLLASRMEIVRLHERLETAKAASFIDALSGLGNRKGFDMALCNAEGSALSAGTPFSLLMIDVDNFKGFNDRYGHLIGDQRLTEGTRRTVTDYRSTITI
jgi:diguanylate cyclase